MKRKSSAGARSVKRRKGTAQYRVQDRTSGFKPLKIKNSKAVKTKVVRKVKVSPGLREKIKKVISDKQYANGSLTDHYIGGGFQMVSRAQAVGGNASTAPSSWHFTIPAFIDAASQLFNGKTPSQDAQTKYRSNQTNQLDARNITFDVKNSYSTYTIKNGSQHAAHIIMCICVPKRKGSNVEWQPNGITSQDMAGSTNACNDALLDATFAWSNGLNIDRLTGMVLPSFQSDKTTLTGAGSVQNASVNDMFRMPSNCRTFNNSFKVEYVKFFLQPGQMVQHYLQGPKMLEIDLAKCYHQDSLINVQKYSRSVFFIGYNSPNSLAKFVSSTNSLDGAVLGRYADQIDNKDSGFPIYVERTDHFSLSIPDQIGFTYPATFVGGSKQNLDRRISRELNNYYDVVAPSISAGEVRTVVDLSVMNPQQPVSDGKTAAA